MTPSWWWKNVERVIAEDKLPPKEATHKSMGQDPNVRWSVLLLFFPQCLCRWPL
ncbi:hypothetical protein ACLBOM_04150 [Escherichia coli]